MLVILLAVAAFVLLRRAGRDSRLRTGVMHSLAMLSEQQDAHRQQFGNFAVRIAPEPGPDAVTLTSDSNAVVTITHADSLGWAAMATNPGLIRPPRTCYIWGGGTAPHDPRLTRARGAQVLVSPSARR